MKVCPSCGSLPDLIETPSDPEEGPGHGYYWYQWVCSCGWSAKACRSYEGGEEAATKSWNTRINKIPLNIS